MSEVNVANENVMSVVEAANSSVSKGNFEELLDATIKSNVEDIPKKGMSTKAKVGIGFGAGTLVGIVGKTVFDVVRAVKRAKKELAEQEAAEANKEENNELVNQDEE